MKRVRCLAFVLVLVALVVSMASTGLSAGKVTLTMGSWRVDDVEQVNKLLAAFTKKNPNIVIKFNPTNPPDYNAVLRTQLTGGTGPDLMYLRSFKVAQDLFSDGFLAPITVLKGLKENYTVGSLSPWTTDKGVTFGVPFMAVSHGVYYNMDLFKKYQLSVPKTWEELMAAAKTLKDAGITPFSNGSKDEWDMNEIVFMNILPSFLGGRTARLEYETGKVPFNDPKMVSVFKGIQDIAPYLPDGQEGVSYYDAQQLFLLGKAAMFFGGSWDVAFFEKSAPDFQWSIFAVPAPAGGKTVVCFHPDCGMGLNKASKFPKEGKLFLSWLTTTEAAQILADEIPGFYPLNKKAVKISKSKHANDFYALGNGKELDCRFDWPVIMDGQPSGYNLTQDAAIAVAKGEMTPEEAADSVQEGLEQWFKPTQHFKK